MFPWEIHILSELFVVYIVFAFMGYFVVISSTVAILIEVYKL